MSSSKGKVRGEPLVILEFVEVVVRSQEFSVKSAIKVDVEARRERGRRASGHLP
jgi:hypothetical protein